MSIVVWVPLTGLPSGLPALTGVVSGTPLPANAIEVPEGYDPADPGGLWDLFPTDQDATYAQSYTPIVLVPPFNITEAIEGVTLSGGTVRMLNYSLTPVATAVAGVTLSGGAISQTMAIEVPAVGVEVAAVVPDVTAEALPDITLPESSVVIQAVAPIVTATLPVDWSLVGNADAESWVTNNMEVTMPAGMNEGDLIVVFISYRGTALISAPSGDWTIHQQVNSGNTSTSTSTSIASGMVATCVRGASDPPNTFTRTGGDVALSHTSAWRASTGAISVASSSINTLASNSFTTTTAGFTTTQENTLLLMAVCAADDTDTTSVSATTSPTTVLAGVYTATGLITTLNEWRLIKRDKTTDLADTAVAVGRAVKTAAGATGTFTSATNASSRHVAIALGAVAVPVAPPLDPEVVDVPSSASDVATIAPEVLGSALVEVPAAAVTTAALAPEIVVTAPPIVLLRMDGANDSTTFTDSGGSAYTVTANGDAKISTTAPKFGSGAALLDGAGDWLYIASPSGNLGAEWTIDMWARWNSLTNGGLFHVFNGTPGSSQTNLALGWEPTPSPAFKVYFNGSGFGASRAYTPTVGQYYHIRLTKTGGDLRLFVEGVLQGAAIADSNSYSSSMGINVGLYYDAAYTFNGRIDEFAVFDTCLSTTGFTPPDAPW